MAMTFDPTSAALGAIVTLAGVSVIAVPALASLSKILERTRKTLRTAGDELFVLQREINDLYEITPARQANGRFAKRQ